MTDRSALLRELSELYATDDAQAVAAFATRIGHDTFKDLHHGEWNETGLVKDFVRPDDAARELDLHMLRTALNHGADLSAASVEMMKQIIMQDDAAALAFLRNEAGCSEQFKDLFGHRWIIVHCGPAIAAEIAHELSGLPDQLISANTFLTTGIVPDRQLASYQIKEFAVLLTASCDVGPTFQKSTGGTSISEMGTNVQRLVAATASNHGRLWLKSLEPSLASILARNPEQGFFGLGAEQLREELGAGTQATWPHAQKDRQTGDHG